MTFKFIDAVKADVCVSQACRIFGVSQSGYDAWRARPASRRQRDDMILLAHIRNAFSLSNETYGSPRMTYDLKVDGFSVGRRRVARLMKDNNIQARRKRRFKRTTDSHHAWPSLGQTGPQPRLLTLGTPEPAGSRLHSGWPQQEMGGRHQLYLDSRGLALSRRRDGRSAGKRFTGSFSNPPHSQGGSLDGRHQIASSETLPSRRDGPPSRLGNRREVLFTMLIEEANIVRRNIALP